MSHVRTVAAVIGVFVLVGSAHAQAAVSRSGSTMTGNAQASEKPAACSVDDKLVPTCAKQALFGAWINFDGNPTGAAGWEQRMTEGERRFGRDIPVRHSYHAPRNGRDNLPFDQTRPDGQAERRFAQAGGIVLANWKPDVDWSKANGSDTFVNDRIRQAAQNIKAVSPHKVMLAVAHEPENDVKLKDGTGPCSRTHYKGTIPGNTPANYRTMWGNVRRIFEAEGATNVVWVMNYMSFQGWDCLVKALWPGKVSLGNNRVVDAVDWVAWDPYSHGASWTNTVGRFYNVLNQQSDAAHPFSSKPYMLAEFGVSNTTKEFAYQWYGDARKALDAGTFPNLRAYVVWDSCDRFDYRTNRTGGSSCSGAADSLEQQQFNRFVQDPLLCRHLCKMGGAALTIGRASS